MAKRKPIIKKAEEREKSNRAKNQVLKKIYLDPKNPASFSSPYKLYNASVKMNKDITLRDVERWLETQNAYTLYRQTFKRFPRRKVVTPGVGYQYQADLLDYQGISKDNRNTRFLLTIIDCFSRFALAVPLKSKQGKDVCEALKTAFSSMGKPVKLQTDKGTEFYNSHVKALLTKLNIHHFSTDQELKAQIVERFNRTLREKIQKYLVSKQSLKYIDALPDILLGYNSSVHSSLGNFAPKDVNKKNEEEVHKIQFGDYLMQKPKKHRYNIGDSVRIVTYQGVFKKTYHKNFTDEVFVIADLLRSTPPTYRVKDSEENILPGLFYEEELQRVRKE